jgi:cytochrome c oxidase cbb3-type subunit III
MKLRLLALLVVGAACEGVPGSHEGVRGAEQPPAGTVSYPYVQTTTLQAGPAVSWPELRNPYEEAVDEGRRLYIAFNCAGCHGVRGGGGIGPPLIAEHYIYGSQAGNIFQSIVQGRPNGMPSFGGRAPDEVIWKITAYVQSMAASDVPQPSRRGRTGAGGGPRAGGEADEGGETDEGGEPGQGGG